MTKFTLTPPWSSPLRWCGCFCGRGHQRRCRAQGQQCSTAWQWHQRRRRTLPLTWSPTVGTHQFSGQSCHTLGTWCTHFPDWNTQHMHLESLRHVSFFFWYCSTHTLSWYWNAHRITDTCWFVGHCSTHALSYVACRPSKLTHTLHDWHMSVCFTAWHAHLPDWSTQYTKRHMSVCWNVWHVHSPDWNTHHGWLLVRSLHTMQHRTALYYNTTTIWYTFIVPTLQS